MLSVEAVGAKLIGGSQDTCSLVPASWALWDIPLSQTTPAVPVFWVVSAYSCLSLPALYFSCLTACCVVPVQEGLPLLSLLEVLLLLPLLQLFSSVCDSPGQLRTSARMWPLWGLDLNRVRCDLLFTEAINQRMQVPNRLKVAESCSPGDRRTVAEDVPASFQMHIPDRISLAGEALGCLLGWLKVGGALQHPGEQDPFINPPLISFARGEDEGQIMQALFFRNVGQDGGGFGKRWVQQVRSKMWRHLPPCLFLFLLAFGRLPVLGYSAL